MSGSKTEWHVLGLSGGRDSAALAVHMRQNHPELDIDYFFTDTGKELPEVYEFLGQARRIFGQTHLAAEPRPRLRLLAQAVQQLPAVAADALVHAAAQAATIRTVAQAGARERNKSIQLCGYPRRRGIPRRLRIQA